MMKNRTTVLRFWGTALAVASILLVTPAFAAGVQRRQHLHGRHL